MEEGESLILKNVRTDLIRWVATCAHMNLASCEYSQERKG